MFDPAAWAAEARRLRDALSTLSPASFCSWSGMERQPSGALSAPYPKYHPLEAALWKRLAEAGVAVAPLDWTAWSKTPEAAALEGDPPAFATASLEDVAMFWLALRRQERFCDGAIAKAFADGHLLAALDRLIALTPELPYDAAASPWAERR